ncbi:MAG TPA: glycerophosphodiester phosphodiesterase family protein [Thioalkalivibrio sp.]|nr:glycerophosphodiester phosphodiesterase family protein [Thioalkalivibrio sp.]
MAIPELIAHRGYAARYPENSLPGIEAAIVAGAQYVEVDVQLSADRVPVLFHDADLMRICGVTGAVYERDFADLAQLYAAETGRFCKRFADNRLASLADLIALLAVHPGVRAFIEIKTEAVAHFGIQAVLDAVAPVLRPVADRCVLISFSIPLLECAHRHEQDPAAESAWSGLGGVIEHWWDRVFMTGLGLSHLFCDVQGLPEEGELAFESARLAVYEVCDVEQAMDLGARGVALIETFALPELAEQMRMCLEKG